MDCAELRMFADYNSKVNALFLEKLGLLDGVELAKDRGGYYGSILSLIHHVWVGDHIWLRRLGALERFACLRSPLLQQVYDHTSTVFDNLADYGATRKALDALITALSREMVQEDFLRTVRFKTSKGIEMQKTVGSILSHVFNHQAHHRGMIAYHLDVIGIENDLCNLITYGE